MATGETILRKMRETNPRDVRDRTIIEALELPWLSTGRIVVSSDGVSWADWSIMCPWPVPRHTTWVATDEHGFVYLTRTYQDMPHSVRRAIERAELDFRRAMGEPIPQTMLEAFEDLQAAWAAILDTLVYSWAIPATYWLAARLSRVQGWLRG